MHLHWNQIQRWGPIRPDSGFDSDVGVLQTDMGPRFCLELGSNRQH